jgi:hypothetical protein
VTLALQLSSKKAAKANSDRDKQASAFKLLIQGFIDNKSTSTKPSDSRVWHRKS